MIIELPAARYKNEASGFGTKISPRSTSLALKSVVGNGKPASAVTSVDGKGSEAGKAPVAGP